MVKKVYLGGDYLERESMVSMVISYHDVLMVLS